jgi:hypothetical protein
MNSITNLTPGQLRRAADIKEKIDALQNEIEQLLGGEAPVPAAGAEKPKKRKMSAAGRARIAAAARLRWAKIKGTAPKRKLSPQAIANIRAGVAKRMAAQGKVSTAKPVRKRRMSAAGLANIRAAQKARWAKARAAGKTAL